MLVMELGGEVTADGVLGAALEVGSSNIEEDCNDDNDGDELES